MTMPTERVRAIETGRELLAALLNDTKLHRPLLATASALTSHYPTATELSLFLAEGRGDFPAAWVRALRRAGDLFTVIWHEQLGSAETQEAARHVLRHYPDEQTLLSLPASPWLGQWLEPPYPFRRPSNPEDASGSIPDATDCSQPRLDSYECEVQFVGELPDLGQAYVQDALGARFAVDGGTDVRTALLIGPRYRALVTTEGRLLRVWGLGSEA